MLFLLQPGFIQKPCGDTWGLIWVWSAPLSVFDLRSSSVFFFISENVEKTFVGETEWILFTIQEFNLTCKQTADVSFCLECTEELKTILEENMKTFCSIDTLGLCCTSACCGPNEFYTNNHSKNVPSKNTHRFSQMKKKNKNFLYHQRFY